MQRKQNLSNEKANLFLFAQRGEAKQFIETANKTDIFLHLAVDMDANLHSLLYWVRRSKNQAIYNYLFQQYENRYLLEQSHTKDYNRYFDYLWRAIIFNQPKTRVAEILSQMPVINLVINNGEVSDALIEDVYFAAIVNGYEAVVRKLSQHQKKFLDNSHVTPLMLAAATKQPEMTKLILENIALFAKDNWHYAFIAKTFDETVPEVIQYNDRLIHVIAKTNDV